MTAIDLSNDLGLVACFLLTFNLLLGLLLAFRYNPWTHWPHHRFNYFRLHNWTAYVALAVAVAHPLVLLFHRRSEIPRLLDLVAARGLAAAAGREHDRRGGLVRLDVSSSPRPTPATG